MSETIVTPDVRRKQKGLRAVVAGLALFTVGCGAENVKDSVAIHSVSTTEVDSLGNVPVASTPDSTVSTSTLEPTTNSTSEVNTPTTIDKIAMLEERLEIINHEDPSVPDTAHGYIYKIGEAACGEEMWNVGVDNVGDVFAQAPDEWLFNLTQDYGLSTPESDVLILAASNRPTGEFDLEDYLEQDVTPAFCSGD